MRSRGRFRLTDCGEISTRQATKKQQTRLREAGRQIFVQSSLCAAHAIALYGIGVAPNESTSPPDARPNTNLSTIVNVALRAEPPSCTNELHVPPTTQFAGGRCAVDSSENIHPHTCRDVGTKESAEADLLGFAL